MEPDTAEPLTDDDLKALKEIRTSIDRWRRMVDEAQFADRTERDLILEAIDSEMGEVLHTKFFKYQWWTP